MDTSVQRPLLKDPPKFCQYASGECDQLFHDQWKSEALFLYPAEPQIVSETIEACVKKLRFSSGSKRWLTWRDMGATGQIIFCQICKAMRTTEYVVADVTTLNFNLLFEIGFAVGLGIPVMPIRDTSFVQDSRAFSELGLIDNLGYMDFQNSDELAGKIAANRCPGQALPRTHTIDKEKPLYVVKSPFQSEGMVRLMSAIKKSGLRFRSFDAKESPRLSIHEAFKNVSSSHGIVLHLMAPDRKNATVHNARCAFLAGLGVAQEKRVLMLQETVLTQPIDYRDVVKCYASAGQIQELVLPLIKSVVGMLQESKFVPTRLALTPLEKVDLGDLAAENEIIALQSYFVPTGQFNEVKRGHARLVVGRKGAGKTAIFYGVREAYGRDRSQLVLDLKPEGHQLVKLRETILYKLSAGMQQHVLTAFWNYLLLMEIAHKMVRTEHQIAYRNPLVAGLYDELKSAYERHTSAQTEQGDFSERLLSLVDDIAERRKALQNLESPGAITELIFHSDIKPLNDAIGQYLSGSRKESIWLLFDNLDKGWPVFDIKQEDIRIITSLLEATRKLQRQFENRSLSLHAVVFLRNDIYQHLVLDPGDRGKETPAILDWNDPEALKDLLQRRISLSTEINEPFDQLWNTFFTSHVRGEESFSFILDRTLMRPREVLRFVRDSINVAVNRRHERVSEEDIVHAEKSYSEDALVDVSLELKDIMPKFADAPYAFIGSPAFLSSSDVGICLVKSGIQALDVEKVRELLLWFGFLGLFLSPDEERYSYQFEHNMQKMKVGVEQFGYCIHPAFRGALGCSEAR